jgi:hypothetical protein
MKDDLTALESPRTKVPGDRLQGHRVESVEEPAATQRLGSELGL